METKNNVDKNDINNLLTTSKKIVNYANKYIDKNGKILKEDIPEIIKDFRNPETISEEKKANYKKIASFVGFGSVGMSAGLIASLGVSAPAVAGITAASFLFPPIGIVTGAGVIATGAISLAKLRPYIKKNQSEIEKNSSDIKAAIVRSLEKVVDNQKTIKSIEDKYSKEIADLQAKYQESTANLNDYYKKQIAELEKEIELGLKKPVERSKEELKKIKKDDKKNNNVNKRIMILQDITVKLYNKQSDFEEKLHAISVLYEKTKAQIEELKKANEELAEIIQSLNICDAAIDKILSKNIYER